MRSKSQSQLDVLARLAALTPAMLAERSLAQQDLFGAGLTEAFLCMGGRAL